MEKATMKKALMGLGAAGLFLIPGCKTYDDYRQERAEYAIKHFERSQLTDIEDGRVLCLVECIEMALCNNLDLKVFNLEESVAREMRTADMLGMLPELNVSNSFTARDNVPASSSKRVDTGGLTYGSSTSQDRNVNYLNIDLALSLLDFGLAFFNTQQGEDRVLLREQRTLRAAQNLTLDVVRVYFQVAAAQRAIDITTQLLEDCRNRYELIAQMGRERQITPFRAFDETRRFIDMEKRLTNYIRSYENSCVELRSLMGLYPGAPICVDDDVLDKVPEFDLPEMIEMEQIALLQRPELYEIDMQKHINILECRKTIVMMFPNVRMFLDFTNSNNAFLYHQSWWEIGIRAAYNLLKLPQHIARYQAYSTQVDAEEARGYAQAIGVMAQVRMAYANMLAVKERYEIDTKVYNAYNENLEWAKENMKLTGELSQLELDHMRLATAETEIERYLSLGNYYVSYFRILNTLGLNDLTPRTVEELTTELEAARCRAQEELERARCEYIEDSCFPEDTARNVLLPMEQDISEGMNVNPPAEMLRDNSAAVYGGPVDTRVAYDSNLTPFRNDGQQRSTVTQSPLETRVQTYEPMRDTVVDRKVDNLRDNLNRDSLNRDTIENRNRVNDQLRRGTELRTEADNRLLDNLDRNSILAEENRVRVGGAIDNVDVNADTARALQDRDANARSLDLEKTDALNRADREANRMKQEEIQGKVESASPTVRTPAEQRLENARENLRDAAIEAGRAPEIKNEVGTDVPDKVLNK